MPFNDKGEFIRSIPESARGRSGDSNRPITLHIPPAGPPRLTGSNDRLRQQQAPQPVRQSGSTENAWMIIGGLLLTLIGLALLAGVVWLVIVYHRWVLVGLALWLIHWVRKL